MARMVASAFVQETVSRVTSYLFSKLDDKVEASRGHYAERLEMAHTELELALERSARMPITDVSLLRRRKLLERAFEDCEYLLHRCSKQQATDISEMEQPATNSFTKRIAQVTQSSISSYFAGFCKDSTDCSDVRRFKWLAECANRFLKDVESGCSPQRCMFSNSLVRKLLQGKTLQYNKVQESILRRLHIWPMCVEGRGVEAALEFLYEDCKMPTRSFALALMLRLSESTDIVGTAITCLQSFTSSMKHMAEAIMGELTRLPLQDISDSTTFAPCFSMQDLCHRDTKFWRQDALCCKPNGCAGYNTPSELSCRFPEQVILVHVECYVLASECTNLHSTSAEGAGRNAVGDWPPLKLGVGFAPHFCNECMHGKTGVEVIEGKAEPISESLHQMDEMVRLKAIDCYIRQPDLSDYRMRLYAGHGVAYFIVRKPSPGTASAPKYNGKSNILRLVKRRSFKRESSKRN